MLLVHKHPTTELPADYEGFPICNDDTVRPGVFYVLDPATYFYWKDGVYYTFAEAIDGTLVHIPWDDCAAAPVPA